MLAALVQARDDLIHSAEKCRIDLGHVRAHLFLQVFGTFGRHQFSDEAEGLLVGHMQIIVESLAKPKREKFISA